MTSGESRAGGFLPLQLCGCTGGPIKRCGCVWFEMRSEKEEDDAAAIVTANLELVIQGLGLQASACV